MTRRDFPPLALLGGILLIQLGPVLFTGRSFFLGDLTYYHHPWRALTAEMLQRGMFPLWNPHAYMGMPLFGMMQTGTLAPGSLPFHFFGFAWALKAHLLSHHALAAFFGYLWLRRWGRAPAATGAALFSLCGFMAGHPGNLVWMGTLAWWPAFFLFSRRPVLLGLAMTASLQAGYPPMWAGMAVAVLVLPWGWDRGLWKRWGVAVALAAGFSAAMLLPGLEMAAQSNRREGTPLEERVAVSLKPRHLAGFVLPPSGGDAPLSGAKYPLWEIFYVGVVATVLAAAGMRAAGRGRALWLAGFLAASCLLLLGGNNPLAAVLWEWTPLRFLRNPAQLAWLPLAALVPLAALALRGRRWAPSACIAVCLELLILGRGIEPTMPDSYFADPGPLARRLQSDLDGHRYLPSPQAALSLMGGGTTPEQRYLDVKHRLYGLSNLPFHIPAAAAMGEAMVLARSYRVMDFLFSLRSAREALPFLPWLDASFLIAKDPPPGLPSDRLVWNLVKADGPARSRWVPEGQPLDGDFQRSLVLHGSAPFLYREPREDRWTVAGTAKANGWIFVANPRYPGWKVYLNGTETITVPALGAFQAVRAGAGQSRVEAVYRPGSFRLGALASLLTAAGLCAWAWRVSRA